MVVETVAGIAGAQLLSLLVAWGQEKVKDKARRKRVYKIFHTAFTYLDNRDPRVGILCDKSDAFRNEMFSFAKGESFDFDRMLEEAREYQKGEGGEEYSQERIGKAFFSFSQCLRQQCKNHGVTTVGEQDLDFNAFDRYVSHIHLGGRGGQAEPTEAKQAPPPVYIPHRPNPLLRHYKSWLEQIEAALHTGAAVVNQLDVSQGVALHGQGGLGKTAMAVAYAYQYADRYPGGVFWVQADLGLGQALAEVATNLGWPLPAEATDQEIIAAVLPRLRTPEPKLVVLDNLNDKVVPKEIETLPASQLLVTTRLSEVSVGQPVSMGLPREEEALGIFLAYAGLEGQELSQAQQEAAYAICRRAGFLPVALEILGKNARKVPLVDLAKALDQAVKQKSTVGTKGQELTIAAALAVTSHNYSHPRAKEALLFLAYFYPEELDRELLALVMEVEPAEAQAMLSALAEFSVVQPKPGGGYAMHRLVQEAARLEDVGQEVGKRMVQVLDVIIYRLLKNGKYQAGYPLIPHLINITDYSTPELGLKEFPSYYALNRWAQFLWQSGRNQISDALLQKMQHRISKAKGIMHPDYGAIINNRAVLKMNQGKYFSAEKLYGQVLKISTKTIGKNCSIYATRLNNLAAVLEKQNKYNEAEKLYRQAIEIDKRTSGENHHNYAISLNNLAGTLMSQGKFLEAEKLYRQAMEIEEKTIGNEHPDYATGLSNLAAVLVNQGKHHEAEKLYRQAFEIDERTIGKEHPNYAALLNNLAGLLRKQGKFPEAEELLCQAASICLRTLGPEHPNTIAFQKGLKVVHNEMKSRA